MENSSSNVPPQVTTPPPPIAPPPATPPRRSWGWIIFSIVLIVLLGFSLLGNFAQAVAQAFSGGFNRNFQTVTSRSAGPRLDEYVLEENNARNKIAVITVSGIIASTPDGAGNSLVDVIKAQLDSAAYDKRVKAVILKVDSPGGEVMASDEINKAIVKFQEDSGKPVVCSMGSLAASGGYYISAPCRWIVANNLTITGSIGVIMHGYNYRGLMDKVGIEPMTFKSGKYKDMLSPDRSTNEIPAGERPMMQALIDETFQKFKGVVRTGRAAAHDKNKDDGRALAFDWEDYADGRVLSGSQALTLGFVDQVGDFDAAVERTEKIAHLADANLIEYRERYDISDFFSRFSQSGEAHDVKFDLGLDIPKLRAGCMYFLFEAN
jgi:protease IV